MLIGIASPLRHHAPRPRSLNPASDAGGAAAAGPHDIGRTVAARRVSSVIGRGFLTIVAVAGAVVLLVSIRDLMRQPVEATWFVLVGLTLVTGWGTLRMRNVPVSFSISDTFTIAAALLFGPAAGTVIVALDALVMSLRVAHENTASMWQRVLFNATATALAMWLAAHVFFALTGAGPLASEPGTIHEVIGPLAVFAGVYFILNTGLIAVAVAHERRASVAAVWRSHFSALWLTYFGGAAIAAVLVLMTVARVIDVKILALIWPLLFILHVTYKAAIDRVQEQVDHLTQIASYAAALRSTADAVLVVDAGGRVTAINPAAERLTGWTESEALGRLGTEVFRALDPATREHDGGAPRADGGTVREYILVRPDGGLSFPLVGDVAASGKSIEALSKEFTERLEHYIPKPVVTIAVKTIGGNRIYVVGKVAHPGEFPFSRPVDVMQALSLAGGTTEFAALNDIVILRRDNGALQAIHFRYGDVERGKDLAQDVLLHSGDTVVVP